MFNSPTSAANGFYAFFTLWEEEGRGRGRGRRGGGVLFACANIHFSSFLVADKSAYLED